MGGYIASTKCSYCQIFPNYSKLLLLLLLSSIFCQRHGSHKRLGLQIRMLSKGTSTSTHTHKCVYITYIQWTIDRLQNMICYKRENKNTCTVAQKRL